MPGVQRNAFPMSPNIWPNPFHVSEDVFRKSMTEYYSKIYALTLQVLDILSAGTPYGRDVFKEFRSDDPKQFGGRAHTDFGAITLLLQDQVGGLQVWDGEGKTWVHILPNNDAYVVNVGDIIETWTCGKYKSNLHRVINKCGSDRFSAPFFFD
ncbi:uncharacterized protein RAG0_08234 [Rhynchosporium agropyri]|uniref:Fe2OG dioxygenase domain-containing protein n=1 Tax=Rhynchosporium agropyri TaxID=914238 RepID=A0A1E1KPZ9_9HELO|nr:uncharacterized protein RAG0_08234 [Rhynchosporium agropyri]